MTSNGPTRKNHYVPVWYQKGFTTGPKLYYLDIQSNPPEQPNNLGRAPLRSPKSCFWAEDLYTTFLGSTVNDEIERLLFGAIDNDGANAVRAMSKDDARGIHDNFQHFFEYLDAQKLRTPKGLDWIRSKYSNLTQLDLMLEMQHLRQMHTTMWFECVREIVSAESSDIKFIVSDHPVTIYNAAIPPASIECSYPNDPSIAQIGSQTIFPLDRENCLILTNLEHAKTPHAANLTAFRTNARFRGQTIARTDSFIRKRKLRREEVASINYILKTRARRYIAAGAAEWLFPESVLPSVDWPALRDILLPPTNELSRFSGELYIGYEDGSTYYQDAFGRTSKVHEYLRRKESTADPEPTDPCGCKSGRSYRKCCMTLPPLSRPNWEVYGIRERNIMLCNAVTDILGLNKGKTWDDIRRELSDNQVKEIHEVLASLWPKNTNVAELLPGPNRRIFRGVFMGVVDPRTLPISVTAQLAYFDEILVINPFPNPSFMRPEHNPVTSPRQHKSQMLKNVLVLLALEPFIRTGAVHLVPDPMELSAEFRQVLLAAAESRDVKAELDFSDFEMPKRLAQDDHRRAIFRMPEGVLNTMLRQMEPDISPRVAQAAISQMKAELEDDPFALLQPVIPGPDGEELLVSRGIALELAVFLAQLTGAAIYTDSSAHWKQLQLHANSPGNNTAPTFWHDLEQAAEKVSFPAEVNPEIILDLRRSPKLGYPRVFFRRLSDHVRERRTYALAAKLPQRLIHIAQRVNRDWKTCKSESGPSHQFDCRVTLSIPPEGFQMSAATRLLVMFGRPGSWARVNMALFVRPVGSPEDQP